ncbi:MAG: hypothetical protein PUD40_01610 [Bacteroidales bacterium]|nr:hypothetical protein [Bacteroidales bacterium]
MPNTKNNLHHTHILLLALLLSIVSVPGSAVPTDRITETFLADATDGPDRESATDGPDRDNATGGPDRENATGGAEGCEIPRDQQDPHRRHKSGFDPEAYFRKMEAYITEQAGLTAAEEKAFFPLFREAKRQQRELSRKIKKQMRRLSQENPNEATCNRILAEVQNLHLQEAQLQNAALREWRKVLSAKKVLKVLKAENEFGRKTFREMTKEE